MTIRRELSEAGIEYEDVVVKVEMVDETFIYNAEMCHRLQRGNFVEGKDLLCSAAQNTIMMGEALMKLSRAGGQGFDRRRKRSC